MPTIASHFLQVADVTYHINSSIYYHTGYQMWGVNCSRYAWLCKVHVKNSCCQCNHKFLQHLFYAGKQFMTEMFLKDIGKIYTYNANEEVKLK